MKPILAIGAVVLLFIAQPGLARDGLYRWTDEQGVRHFSDHPPLDNKPPAGPVEIKKKESSGSAPAMPATPPLSPSVSESPIKATQEMILGKWKPSMSQIGNEVAEQMKTDSGKKNEGATAGKVEKAVGDAIGAGLVLGMMESMRIEFTRDTITTEIMGKKEEARKYAVVKIENNVLTLRAEGKKNDAIVHILDDSRISLQEVGKGGPMVMIRDDGGSK